MWQAQKKIMEREERRKNDFPVGIILGHMMKNCMTVIVLKRQMGRYRGFMYKVWRSSTCIKIFKPTVASRLFNVIGNSYGIGALRAG